ncbi:MAG TPA: sigma-54 dependent transcriptional regulator [Candidatus Acidoferrales bacterium]|nr:sigma-54 dependent transcriptional regulator [Candidatus Acidoferrales bacterium]
MTPARLEWIADDPASARLYELAQKVAETSATLLITGESGAGKDYLARVVHELSSRRDAPFLKIDCASLPQELVESELFGHERGAFTGAVERKLGRFEMAGEGTIVLDEIAALSGGTQSKLLRVLEERTFERLGGTETLRIDARLIALTNADLRKGVAEGRFREDLFFRLNVVTLDVPPLRERPADLLPITKHLLVKLASVHGRPEPALSEEAWRAIAAYGWPGNVRELRNALERALIFSNSAELVPADFPEPVRAAAAGSVGALVGLRSLEEVEREVIASTLEATRYKISKAAGILGISRKTLLEKRKRYGLK